MLQLWHSSDVTEKAPSTCVCSRQTTGPGPHHTFTPWQFSLSPSKCCMAWMGSPGLHPWACQGRPSGSNGLSQHCSICRGLCFLKRMNRCRHDSGLASCVVLKTERFAGTDRGCVFLSDFSKGLIAHKVLTKGSLLFHYCLCVVKASYIISMTNLQR